MKGGQRRCEETIRGCGTVQDKDDGGLYESGDEGDRAIVMNSRNIQTRFGSLLLEVSYR